MLIYIIAVTFIIFTLFFLLCLLCCLTFISCLGWLGFLKDFVIKHLSISYDRQFVQNQINDHPINSQCYICLQRIDCQVVTTCNHSFCAHCITSYIDSKPNESIGCPACRKQVCLLFRKFNPTTQQQKQLKQKICQYNFKYARQPGMVRSILQIGTFIRQAPQLLTSEGIRYLMTSPRVKVILLMIMYIASPLDILPEALLGPIGLLDDTLVMANLAQQFSGLLVNFVGQEGNREGNQRPL